MVSFINLSTYFYNLSLIRNIDSYYRKYDTSEVVKLLGKGFLGYECIKDNPDFWKTKNYIAADTIVIATRYNSNDIELLPSIIETVQGDGKKILLVLNIFEFPGEASGYSLIDKVILNNLGASVDVLSLEVNRSYFNYFNSSSNNKSSNINAKLSQIANDFGIPTLNRMDYVCDVEIEQCFAVDVDLSKNFYDYGHHTISGSQYFSRQAGLEKFIQPLLSSIK